MKVKLIWVDLAKSAFQVHGVDSHERVQVRKQLMRCQMLDFFGHVEPCVIAMEACGSAHYSGRELVKLVIPAKTRQGRGYNGFRLK